MMMNNIDEKTFAQSIEQCETMLKAGEKYSASDFPKVSIIIPTHNDAQLISVTLESVLMQNYPSFEIIIVDASEDRTLETIKNFHSDKVRIYSVSQSRRYDMLNKGLSHAHGMYVNFLFPGDFYISKETLNYMMILALENEFPQLVYCGTLLRDGKSEVKILFRKFGLDLLKRGQQPTSLQACWFRTDCIRQLNKFNSSYSLRGGYELMCRFAMRNEYRVVSANRVLTDYDLRAVTRPMMLKHFWETFRTVLHFFGPISAFRWLFIQHDMRRFLKLWLRSLKVAFLGR